jgi:VRR-NUC domain-containing protein
MSPEDRAHFAPEVAEPEKPKPPMTERKEQGTLWNWLLQHSYLASWHRTDRRTGAVLGVPDFIIPLRNGITVWMELKIAGGRLSKEQEQFRDYLRANGHHYYLCFSADEAIRILHRYEHNDRHITSDPAGNE